MDYISFAASEGKWISSLQREISEPSDTLQKVLCKSQTLYIAVRTFYTSVTLGYFLNSILGLSNIYFVFLPLFCCLFFDFDVT